MENPICFFTATNLKWQHLLKPDKYKHIIIDSLKFLAADNRVWIYGFVVMPNHIHHLWRLKEPHKQEEVQRDFLKFTAQKIKEDLIVNHPAVLPLFISTQSDRKYQFWERRAYSAVISTRASLEQRLDYIHLNPVQEKWKLASLPENYMFSSARYYLLNENDRSFITHYTEHI